MPEHEEHGGKQSTEPETTEKSGWKKIISEPTERKGGYSGSELANDAAPEGAPGVVVQDTAEQDASTDQSK